MTTLKVIELGEYHGPKGVEPWLKWGRRHVRSNKFLVIAIDGEPGNGKSSLARILTSKLQDEPFNIQRQMCLAPKDMEGLAKLNAAYRVLWCDEASRDGGNKRRALSRGNVETMEHMQTTRRRNHVEIYVTPIYTDLDTAILDHVKWVFRVVRKGWAEAYELRRQEIRGKYNEVVKVVVGLVYRFEFGFPDPAVTMPDEWKEYNQYRDDLAAGRKVDGRVEDLVLEDLMVNFIQASIGPVKPPLADNRVP